MGHWKREGIDPVKALQQTSARLKSLHFKDIEAPSGNTEQHDTIWGTGVCNVAEMLQILKTSNFKGLMSVEYENNWYNSVPDIAKCVKYMEQNIGGFYFFIFLYFGPSNPITLVFKHFQTA